jgi:hypothetical protein
MEEDKKADDLKSLTALLQRLVDSVRSGQEFNRRMLENHSQGIAANRDAITGLLALVSEQNRAINAQREVIAKIFEQLNPPAVDEGPKESVN